jgi:hypothetical protein
MPSKPGGKEPESAADLSFNIILWLVLPSMAANFLQKAYYRFRFSSTATHRPQPGTPKFVKHYNRCYMLVVGVYLAYCLGQIVFSLPPNYYQTFGISRANMEAEIKPMLRKYSLMYHPDRDPSAEAEAKFMSLRRIYETLSVPLTRGAYERFGNAHSCQNCILARDYLYHGLMEYVGFYLGTLLVLVILNVVGEGQSCRYWRFLALFGMAALELLMLVSPGDPLPWFLPRLTSAEKITVLHHSYIYLFIAVNHFAPILFPKEENDLLAALKKLDGTSKVESDQVEAMLSKAVEPYAHSSEDMSVLKTQMKRHAVQLKLFEIDPEYRRTRTQLLGDMKKPASA